MGLSFVGHSCNPSTQEAEAGGLIGDQPGLQGETLSQKPNWAGDLAQRQSICLASRRPPRAVKKQKQTKPSLIRRGFSEPKLMRWNIVLQDRADPPPSPPRAGSLFATPMSSPRASSAPGVKDLSFVPSSSEWTAPLAFQRADCSSCISKLTAPFSCSIL
jgi:hypothetical protein